MNGAVQRPYGRAIAWLVGLGVFFFVSYNAANDYAASLDWVPTIGFEWERHLPFLSWTIVPYWSSDLLYAASFFLFRKREDLDRHGLRLLAIQIFSICCFVVFPLRASFVRPPVEGLPGWLFAELTSFDKNFNQMPSLHVSLAVILWFGYRRVLGGWARQIAAGWFLLMGVSAWTTYQHQFLDLPFGAWAGLMVVAAIPERQFAEARRPGLAGAYLVAAMALALGALVWRGPYWLALWPAFSLSMVACGYWTGDPAWLGKRNGSIGFWMWPYTLGAWINSRIWTWGEEPWQQVAEGVWIGRAPGPGVDFAAVVDLTAEMPVKARYSIPVLDLVLPNAEQIKAAVAAIEAAPRPVLVCCALGYSRSATVAAAWLVAVGQAESAAEAITKVRQVRPQVVLSKEAERRVGEPYRRGI